eukprot:717990-Amphidinium_carterae.1
MALGFVIGKPSYCVALVQRWGPAFSPTEVADGVPYCVWAHSVGTWVAFEFLILARKLGLPMPRAAFLNAFPSPTLPLEKRPWPQSRHMPSDGIKGDSTCSSLPCKE